MTEPKLLNLLIYRELRKRLRASRMPWAQLQELRLQQLRELLTFCREKHDFYRKRFDHAGFQPARMRSLEEMEAIPPLTKEEYREFTTARVMADPRRYERWFQDGTSGSTGIPLKIYRDRRERAYMLAKYMRALFLNGYRYRDVTFCLPSPHRMNESDSILQRFGLLTRICVPYTAPVEEMVSTFRKQPVDLLYANRSHLVLMAEYIRAHGIEIRRPRLICSSSEMMDPSSRRLIEEVFGEGRLFEVYGSVEFNNLAFQVIGKPGFQFNHDTNIIELEDERGRVGSASGRCLITDLRIRSFPLIRYRLDDWIELENGDGAARIKRIVGRSDDWFILADGGRKPFHPVYEIMESEAGVRQFRFIQQAIDRIDVQLVTDGRSARKELEQRLLAALNAEFRGAVRFRFQHFASLPADPGGKLRMVISNVKADRPA